VGVESKGQLKYMVILDIGGKRGESTIFSGLIVAQGLGLDVPNFYNRKDPGRGPF
jgi:hypothetical protein